MTFWPLTDSDFPTDQTFLKLSWPWYQDRLSPNDEWFQWSICNECGMPAGHAYAFGTPGSVPFLGLACAPIVETRFLELTMYLLDFSPWIPLVTFSIVLCIFVLFFSTWRNPDFFNTHCRNVLLVLAHVPNWIFTLIKTILSEWRALGIQTLLSYISLLLTTLIKRKKKNRLLCMATLW